MMQFRSETHSKHGQAMTLEAPSLTLHLALVESASCDAGYDHRRSLMVVDGVRSYLGAP